MAGCTTAHDFKIDQSVSFKNGRITPLLNTLKGPPITLRIKSHFLNNILALG